MLGGVRDVELKSVPGGVRDAALYIARGVRDAAFKSVLGGVRDVALFIARGHERCCT